MVLTSVLIIPGAVGRGRDKVHLLSYHCLWKVIHGLDKSLEENGCEGEVSSRSLSAMDVSFLCLGHSFKSIPHKMEFIVFFTM